MKLVSAPSFVVEESRGFYAGPDRSHLIRYPGEAGTVLSTDIFTPKLASLLTKTVEENITATWSKAGRAVIRQPDPLPLSILGIILNGPVGG